MDWKKLKQNQCPKCGLPLTKSLLGDMFACSGDTDEGHFRISMEKFEQIVDDLYKPKERSKGEEQNLSDLNLMDHEERVEEIDPELEEVNDLDREEIARLIRDGNTSGILDSEGYRITWSLDIEKFKS